MVTVIILGLMILFFIGGWMRADLVALIGLVLLVLTNQLTPAEAMAGVSNPVVLMIAGLFIVGAGLFHSGLAERLASLLIPYANGSEMRLFFLFMMTVTLLSSVMSNTGTVAILIPVALAMSRQMKKSPAVLLMPLAFFSSIGGTMTLIGTPPNLVAAEALRRIEGESIGFFALFPIGLAVAAVSFIYFRFVGNKLLTPEETVDPSVSSERNYPEPKIYAVHLDKNHPLIGQRLRDLKWSHQGLIVVGERIRGVRQRFIAASADTVLREGRLLVSGEERDIESFTGREGLRYEQLSQSELCDKESGVALFTVPPDSSLVGKRLSDSRLRNDYQLNVLQVVRPNEEIAQIHLKDVPLQRGDLLVVQGKWGDLERTERETQLLLANERVTDVANRSVSERHQLAAGLVMVTMIALFMLEWVDPTVAVWIAALAMILTGAVRHIEVAYQSIQWSSLVLIAAMIPVGTALDHAGVMSWLVSWISTTFGEAGPVWVLVALFAATMFLSQIISNTATAVLFVPLALSLAETMGVNPIPFVVAVAISASLAFMTPFGSPTNAMVFSIGGYRFVDFMKVGIPLQLITGIVGIIMILLLFPL
ncbi:SLC13 family permease [Exiguobacterium algae]|uniref:SLC13 family permease n=1 Tax=Exiguobacterium algae TaxID=2751250 RepID=UPI001BEA2EE7|nr:SLC13 family permease [Exiguobacterium algae]